SKLELDAVRHIHQQGRLPIRFYVQPGYGMLDSLLDEGLKTGDGNEMLRMGAIKIFADGSMGARTAALTEDFADDPGNRGILLHSDEELTEMVRKVHKSGWQVAIHAIGDRAVEQAINAIETALRETGEDNRTRRHRIEHASLLNEDLIFRMADLHILASVQPQFIITDFWTINRVGPERYRWAYPFRTLLQSGVPLSLGSDCPVENLDAFELIYRAVTRDDFSQSECLTVEETIALYSLGGAYAMFQEKNLGSIEVGKFADLVILNQDIFSVPSNEIPNCRPDMVFVGGKRKV
ncbi:MAG: amidohydrolase family protein, partial [Armatimonadota bacterium]|nr:amidohydrolase family protein [Armatimonadota bacterium]